MEPRRSSRASTPNRRPTNRGCSSRSTYPRTCRYFINKPSSKDGSTARRRCHIMTEPIPTRYTLHHAAPPANFVNPGQALPLRLESHKHRDSIATAITRRMGGTTKDVGVPIYQGSSTATPAELTHKQDPAMFADRLAGAFKIASMGVLALEPAVLAIAGAGYVMKGWPDELTAVRLYILFPMLPSTMAVTRAIYRRASRSTTSTAAWPRYRSSTSRLRAPYGYLWRRPRAEVSLCTTPSRSWTTFASRRASRGRRA